MDGMCTDFLFRRLLPSAAETWRCGTAPRQLLVYLHLHFYDFKVAKLVTTLGQIVGIKECRTNTSFTVVSTDYVVVILMTRLL